jgi:hypothetical protein
LTVAEYAVAPTGVDLSNLLPSGTAAEQTARLSELIGRASSICDGFCDQVLGATTDTETERLSVNRAGEIYVHPRNWPVIAVTDFRYGSAPTLVSALTDLSGVWVETHGFTVTTPVIGLGPTNQGPLQFGGIAAPGRRMFCQWTYVNGWPNTTLAAPVLAGANTFTVVDPTGIYASNGTHLTIYDGTVSATGVPAVTERGLLVTGVLGSVVTVSPPLAYGHIAGVGVSALPDAVKQAVIYLTTALIRSRGSDAIVLESMTSGRMVQSSEGSEVHNLVLAADALDRYRRVR